MLLEAPVPVGARHEGRAEIGDARVADEAEVDQDGRNPECCELPCEGQAVRQLIMRAAVEGEFRLEHEFAAARFINRRRDLGVIGLALGRSVRLEDLPSDLEFSFMSLGLDENEASATF